MTVMAGMLPRMESKMSPWEPPSEERFFRRVRAKFSNRRTCGTGEARDKPRIKRLFRFKACLMEIYAKAPTHEAERSYAMQP